jgi:hypothetical protein
MGWLRSNISSNLKGPSYSGCIPPSLRRTMTFARLDAFTRGKIVGMRAAGAVRKEIVKKTRKKDGTKPSLRAVDAVLAKTSTDPDLAFCLERPLIFNIRIVCCL